MPINILMPALSPTMEKGNLAKWLKKEGDKVKSGDVIAEIETDKATMEVEAVDEGTIARIVVPEGTQDVAVNDVIAVLAGDGEDVKAAGAGAAARRRKPLKRRRQNLPRRQLRLPRRRREPQHLLLGARAAGRGASSAGQRARPHLLVAACPTAGKRSRHRAYAHQRIRPARPDRRPRCRGSEIRQGAEGPGGCALRRACAGAVDVGPADPGVVRRGQLRSGAARRHAPHYCAKADGLGADCPAFLSDDGLRHRQAARGARGDQRGGAEGQGEEAALQALGQ